MKYVCLIALILCISNDLKAQSIDRFVIGSTGAYVTTTDYRLAFTVGETLVGTVESGSFWINQGFHQIYQQERDTSATSLEDPVRTQITYRLYPNPTSGFVTLDLQADEPIELVLDLLDMQGRKTTIPSRQILLQSSQKERIDLSPLSAGVYVLSIRSVSGQIAKHFRIVKQN